MLIILQKTCRFRIIDPTVVNNKTELVEANSKLGLISGGRRTCAPTGALAAISPKLSLLFGIVVFLCAVVAAMKLPVELWRSRRSRPNAWSCATLRSGPLPWQ